MRRQMGKIDEDIFICIDCEATGLDADKDRIIEIAIVKFRGETILESAEWLVNPECEIPETSIAIHNITPDMVKDAPKESEILAEVLRIAGNHIVVGHGISFDIALVVNAAKRSGIHCTLQHNRTIDTLRMARLYGESKTNSLNNLRQHFNVTAEGAHRAMSDVIVNIEVFRHLARSFRTSEEIMRRLEKPIMMKTMPLGKYKGRLMKEVPLEFLYWMANKNFDMDLLFSVRTELQKRKKGNLFGQSSNPFSDL